MQPFGPKVPAFGFVVGKFGDKHPSTPTTPNGKPVK